MIAIAGDHHAAKLMESIGEFLDIQKTEWKNLGAKTVEEETKLEEIIPAVAEAVRKGDSDFGILACGTGVGVAIGANRFRGIRASLCNNPKQAEYARIYDNANVLCLASWEEDERSAKKILESWFGNEFDGNEKRTKMIETFDTWQ